jgi:hypothetical protein
MVFVFAVLLAFGLGRSQQAEGQIARPKSTQQWEYKVVDVSQKVAGFAMSPEKAAIALTDDFTKLGQDGWDYQREIAGTTSGTLVVFKRAK